MKHIACSRQGQRPLKSSRPDPQPEYRWPVARRVASDLVLRLVCSLQRGRRRVLLAVNQAVRLGVALVAMLIVAQLPPDFLRRWTPWGYLSDCAAGAGTDQGRCWSGCAPLAGHRYSLPAVGSHETCRADDDRLVPARPSNSAQAWPPGDDCDPDRRSDLLIAKQPDLGTSLLIAASGIIVIVLAGMSFKLIFGLGVLAIPGALVLWNFMQDYQKQRVLTLLNPDSDPLGAGYNIIQSKIAIGSGGLFGKGWTNGSQAHLEFLPERHTDFHICGTRRGVRPAWRPDLAGPLHVRYRSRPVYRRAGA